MIGSACDGPKKEARSSLEYWEQRWAEDPWNFGTSWPDTYARLLEVAFIRRTLGRFDRKLGVLDFGCGNLQLAESNALLLELASRGYLGLDGAGAALTVASQRVASFGQMDVALEDFTRPGFGLKEYLRHFPVLVSKRTLQNLTPVQREELWPEVFRARHGILVEGTQEGLEATNRIRRATGLEELAPPAFNFYLSDGEVERIRREKEARVEPFLSHYYYETRAVRNLRTWDGPTHREAYKEALARIASEQYTDLFGDLGPVMALVW